MKTKILVFRSNDPKDWRNCYYASKSQDWLIRALQDLGEVTVAPLETTTAEHLRLMREHDVLMSPPAPALPKELVQDRGRLNYLCCLHGGVKHIVSREHIEAGLVVTNWGDAPGHGLAALSMTLLLALLRELPAQIDAVRAGAWRLDAPRPDAGRIWGGSCDELRVGIYGLGFAGRRFIPMAGAMGMVLSGFDPYVDPWPEGVRRFASLEELFANNDAIIICAALTDETRNSVTRQLLASLPNGGIVINTARGAVLDQGALFDELTSGRLRAGLDVLEPDELDPEHPVRQLPNCILSCHGGPSNRFNPPSLGIAERYAVENVRRIREGQPLQWVLDLPRYDRMS